MIHLRILGELDLTDPDGQSVDALLSQPKRIALLTYLALAAPRGFKRRDTLLGVFWPEHDEARARAALNKALHLLRKALGSETIVSRGDEVGLDRDRIRCDAVDFEELFVEGRLEEAVELYQGEPLPGFFLSGSPEFERWLDDERIRLRERARSATATLIEHAMAAGDTTAATHHARRALDISNDERALRTLIEVLDAAGDRADALREYQRFAHRLEQEFDATPAPETVALIERVRSREEPSGMAAGADARGATVDGTKDEAADGKDRATPTPTSSGAGHAEPTRASSGTDQAASTRASSGADQAASTRASSGADDAVPARRTRWTPLAVAALAIVTAMAVFIGTRDRMLAPNRVLVATFEHRGDDPTLEPLGRNVAEWIAQELAGTRLVEIVDPATAHAVTQNLGQGRQAGLARNRLHDAARRTGAGIVVSGSYLQQGDSLRFDARITDASRGELLAGVGPYFAPVDDPHPAIEALHDRVAGALAIQLDPRLEFMGALGGPPPRLEAYQAWMSGVEAFGRMDFPAAIGDLQRAHALDPAFATPLIWMALAFANAGMWDEVEGLVGRMADARASLGTFDQHFADVIEAWLRGRIPAQYEAARRMVEVAPNSEIALVLLAQAALMIDRPRETIETLERIDLERIPVDFKHWIAVTHGEALHLMGDYTAQLELARRLRADRPGNPGLINQEAMALAALGRFEELQPAVEAVQSRAYSVALELRAHGQHEALHELLTRAERVFRDRLLGAPADPDARRNLGFILYLAGEWEEAESIFRALAAERPESLLNLGMSGLIAALRGDLEAAASVDVQLARAGAARSGAQAYWRARIAGALGDRDRTIQLLRESFDLGNDLLPQAIHTTPEFELIRDAGFFGEREVGR